jgi:hypothetical protein
VIGQPRAEEEEELAANLDSLYRLLPFVAFSASSRQFEWSRDAVIFYASTRLL